MPPNRSAAVRLDALQVHQLAVTHQRYQQHAVVLAQNSTPLAIRYG
jgi:hypothetical protein